MLRQVKWFLLVVLLTSLIPLRSVLLGGFPFWFDPARDLLLAADNLKKITLIGSPTGIPGLFYGPYWIWLLSLPMAINPDPRWIVGLVLTLPYFTIFPFLLWKLRSLLGTINVFSLWILFILGFVDYATFIWNPHLSPVILLIVAYLVSNFDSKLSRPQEYFRLFLIGFFSALILSFHFSLGIAVVAATFLTILVNNLKSKKITVQLFIRLLINITVFTIGVFLTLLPFAVFEFRHGFNQTTALINSLSNSILYNSAVVGQVGMSRFQILSNFPTVLGHLFHLSTWVILGMVPILYIFIQKIRKHEVNFSSLEKQLILFLLLNLGVIFYIFWSSKNPVWPYHFIGIETLFLLLIGIVLKRFPLLEKLILLWSVVILIGGVIDVIKTPIPKYENVQSYKSKYMIVNDIFKDAGHSQITIYSYSAALYTYDFDYLISAVSRNNHFPHPIQNPDKSIFVYLIIPKSPQPIVEDFINYRTSSSVYKTIWQKLAPDQTLIIKRQKI